jgi:hypothetical protein
MKLEAAIGLLPRLSPENRSATRLRPHPEHIVNELGRSRARQREPGSTFGYPASRGRRVTIILDYPHDTRTHEPLLLRRQEVWRMAEEAREQLCQRGSPQLDFTDLAAKARRLSINGIELETRWEFAERVVDDRGHAVLGAIAYEPSGPREALVHLNQAELAERVELVRSTAAHELAHAIFDVPGWIRRADREPEPQTSFRTVVRRYRRSHVRPTTTEWRANEFMGAFLAPPGMLRRQMLKVIAELGLPRSASISGLPILDIGRLGPWQVQAVADELAERLGLTLALIEYRLHLYGFARCEA